MGHHRISLDVMSDLVKSLIFPDQMSPESALVNGPSSPSLRTAAPADGMGRAQPMESLGEHSWLLSLCQQVPVIGHQAEGKDFNGERLQHFPEGLFKKEIVSVIGK